MVWQSTLILVLAAGSVSALGGPKCITSTWSDLVLASKNDGWALPILLDSSDVAAIHVAASTFADDIQRVTDIRPNLYNDSLPSGTDKAILVGTVGSSLISKTGATVDGDWEAYYSGVMSSPFDGVSEALVIAGSDKRGTIYGMYDLSEQMGVSPWYWWADVPTPSQDVVAFSRDSTCSHGEPTVKYRGVFINDEQPVLWNWAKTYYNLDEETPPFQTWMYEPIFELILRLKANYFWPAMWAAMFDVDGLDVTGGLPSQPIAGPNQLLADKYGIVMGTSHQEPMGRNTPEWSTYGDGDWNFTANSEFLTEFWTYGAERAKGLDTLFTVGMRGNGDIPLPGANIPIMENITSAQQAILRKVFETEDLNTVPQMWAMYKEVMGYFANGLTVPDDVTILLADDNWGNLMAVLPWGDNHTAGGGIYYHADYVGSPRDYKWLNTVPLAKMWEQLNVATSFNTTDIWILNVGDMKMLELPIEWFLSIAYDSPRWPINSLHTWLACWAEREFGVANKWEVADIMATYSMYVSRIKPELLNSTLWSLVNYDEAETLLSNWTSLAYRAKCVYESLPSQTQSAFFELVYSPVALNANLNRLYISVGKSNLYASQFKTSANIWAYDAMSAFSIDHNITEWFYSLENGKWKYMLAQPHINYAYWQQPMRNTLPPISFVQQSEPSFPGGVAYTRYTVENSLGAWPGDNQHNCAQGYSCPDPTLLPLDPYGAGSRWVEVASGGPMDVSFTATPNVSWISVSQDSGWIKKDGSADTKVYISVDWSALPAAPWSGAGTVNFTASDGAAMIVTVPVNKTASPPSDWSGFVEGDGYVVIEAAHYTSNASAQGYDWEEIDWYGRTLSGMEMLPVTNRNFSLGQGPLITYDFWAVDSINGSSGVVQVTIQVGPALNYFLGDFLAFGFQLDNNKPFQINPVPFASLGSTPADWNNVVAAEIRNVTVPMNMTTGITPGAHNLTLWGMTTGVVVERIWIDMGGIASRGWSYLGPPESKRISRH
ncbi:hypothetical protein BCR39DRAFT_533377 [Naematelia encephala]|uniref:Gylcosyl hydrolase 115 C-terminal domain-containing protein n=1 Tax=Naematelia encephala TaxID=71784 RepID=A0A1Y2B346_9TREE|nr:hypothetical protein BCR39DRAFT_533377 [Naematelia encephala]